MLAVGFDDKLIAVRSFDGRGKKVAELGLEPGVNVQFGLFDGDQRILRNYALGDDGQYLAYPIAHIGHAHCNSPAASGIHKLHSKQISPKGLYYQLIAYTQMIQPVVYLLQLFWCGKEQLRGVTALITHMLGG